jgi:hypothetical protein
MTVTVETPEGIKSGSAVREVSSPPIRVIGEAVIVDLGQHGVLFATLSGNIHGVDYGSDIIFNLLPITKQTKSGLDRIPPIGQKITLTPDQYPKFVRFRDLQDPTTVENATILEKTNSTPRRKFFLKDEVFGFGVRLQNITVEMTNDPVTWGIEKWLPWLPARAKKDGYLGQKNKYTVGDPTGTYLTGREFSKGKFWY